MPLTLIDATTTANISRDLSVLAASWHFARPCYAQTLQRAAAQVLAGYDAAAAVAGMTTTPTHNETLTEVTLTEVTLSEITPTDVPPGGGIL